MTDRKHISRRPMRGLKDQVPAWAQLGIPETPALSDILDAMYATGNSRVHLCGSLEQMPREYMMEPLACGWRFAESFVFKTRTATYMRENGSDARIAVRLVSHRNSWLPDCEDMDTARAAWGVLESEWKETGLPLLSSPAATGKALLWESLPRDPKTKEPVQFPCLDDDLAQLIRRNSPQHRIEVLTNADCIASYANKEPGLYQYDGRWMYAAMCGLDRFPVGEPRKVYLFNRYQPGWYHVTMRIPSDWKHIGLIPVLGDNGWEYPSEPGREFTAWVAEPELTLACDNYWRIVKCHEGYAFDKGRPLDAWAKTLIDMRAKFQKASKDLFEKLEDRTGLCIGADNYFDYAAAAVRQVLNHTIGAIHVNGYEREKRVSESDWKQWRRDNAAWLDRHDYERADDGAYVVSEFVPSESPLDIYMPHWSSTLYSLARAHVARWALQCDGKYGRPGHEALVKIHGDAIYSTVELPFEDNGKLGQLRRKS